MPVLKKSIRSIEHGITITAVVTIGMVVCRLLQLFLFYDPEAGLLQPVLYRYILDGLLLAFAAAAVFAAFEMAKAVGRAGELSLRPLPVNGVGMLLAGLGFLVQGILGLSDGLNSTGFDKMVVGFMDGIRTSSLNLLPLAVTVLSFGSAVTMTIAGLRILTGRGRLRAALFLCPVLWSGVLIPFLLSCYPNVTSVQADSGKTILAALALIYTFDLFEQYTSEGAPDTLGRLMVRFVFPVLAAAGTLPYLLAAFAGTRDRIAIFPHFALLGLAACGGISLLQIALNALSKLYKQRRIGRYQPPAGADRPDPNTES